MVGRGARRERKRPIERGKRNGGSRIGRKRRTVAMNGGRGIGDCESRGDMVNARGRE